MEDGLALLTRETESFALADHCDEAVGRYLGLQAGRRPAPAGARCKAGKPNLAGDAGHVAEEVIAHLSGLVGAEKFDSHRF